MKSFEDLFLKSKGQPVDYDGRTIQMVDRLKIGPSASIRLIFESVDADWRQGISLTIDGCFEVNGQKIEKSIVLWQDSAPQEVALSVLSKKGELQVKNVWDVGDGTIHSWHNGAAMIVEGDELSRRYLCNDGRADDDFNDLVFRLEIEKN
jgi:hypothetical protein